MNQGVKEYVSSLFEGKPDDINMLKLKDEFINKINSSISKYLDLGNDYKVAFEKSICDFENEITDIDYHISSKSTMDEVSAVPLTDKFRFGSLMGGFWICSVIVYFFYSMASGNWHTSWTIFLFAASISVLISAMNGGGVRKGHLIGAFWPSLVAVYILLSFALGIRTFSWILFLFGALFCVLFSGYKKTSF